MKTIYFLNAYHLGWSSWPPWPPGPPGPPGSHRPPEPPAHCSTLQPSTAQYSPLHRITAQYSPVAAQLQPSCSPAAAQLQPSTSQCSPSSLLTLSNLLPNFPFRNRIVYFVLFSSLFVDNCWCPCEYQVISVWRREKETSPFLLSLQPISVTLLQGAEENTSGGNPK